MSKELQQRMNELSEGTQAPMTQAALIFGGIINENLSDPAVQKAIEDAKETAKTTNDPAQWIAGLLAEAATDGKLATGGGGGVTQAELDAEVNARKAADTLDTSQWKAAVATEAAIRAQQIADLGGGNPPSGGEVTQGELDAERTARVAGDAIVTAEWQAGLANEVVARNAAIAAAQLGGGGGGGGGVTQAQLDAEVDARVAGDAQVNNAWTTAVNAEIVNRIAGDLAVTNATQVKIDAEAATRAAADTALSNRVTTLEVNESPFVTVDTQSQLDAALTAGRSIRLRAEGTGGVIACNTPKVITARYTTMEGGGHLQFTLPPLATGGLATAGYGTADAFGNPVSNPPNTPAQSPRAITILADDVTLRNFELSNTVSIATNTAYGIALSEAVGAPGHRLKLLDMHVHNWARGINKDANFISTGLTAPVHEDILIERLNAHTFNWSGAVLNYGFKRLVMRDSRILGYLSGVEFHTTQHNIVSGGGAWYDCAFENCLFANGGRLGFEAIIPNYPYFQERTRMSNCRVENMAGYGISIMFATETVLEKCRVKNVHFNGIEVGGRNPEYHPNGYRYGTGIIDSCEVDGVDSWGLDPSVGGGQAVGISIDAAMGYVVRGATKVSNITSSMLLNGAAGIGIVSSERCSVQGATLTNVGHIYLYITHGPTAPNNRGGHIIENNTCRNESGSGVHMAVYVFDTSVEVRNNTVWQKAGTTLDFRYSSVAPALVTVDGVALIDSPTTPPGDAFASLGSNIILLSPLDP